MADSIQDQERSAGVLARLKFTLFERAANQVRLERSTTKAGADARAPFSVIRQTLDAWRRTWQSSFMPTDVAKPKPTPALVLQEMAQLTARQLDAVMEQAAVLRLQKRKQVLGPRESDLLRTINRGLSAANTAKLEELQQKLRNETISRR